MENKTLNNIFCSLQEQMKSRVSLSKNLKHPIDMGDVTEKNWIKWFNNYLPKRYRAAKATVFDSKGNMSDQIDVVIYDSQYSYLALNDNGIMYLPSESVYAVFELKQKLSKTNIEYAGKKAESVRKLYRTSAPIVHAGGTYPPKSPPNIIAGIITSDVSWKKGLGNSFIEALRNLEIKHRIDIGCDISNGSYVIDYIKDTMTISNSNQALVFFFLSLLSMLQKMGTVPAIVLEDYIEDIVTQEVQICGIKK